MDQIIRIGMDTSKHIFQLHGVNAAEEPVLRKKLRRKDMIAFFAKLDPVEIALEGTVKANARGWRLRVLRGRAGHAPYESAS